MQRFWLLFGLWIRMMLFVASLCFLADTVSNLYKIVKIVNAHKKELPFSYTDSTLVNVVKSFKYEAGMHGIDVETAGISVLFGTPQDEKDPKAVGSCLQYKSGARTILVRQDRWEAYDPYRKEALIFHELGHCILHREHCDVKAEDIPISIMYYGLLDSKFYEEHRDDLLEELFHADSRCTRTNAHSH